MGETNPFARSILRSGAAEQFEHAGMVTFSNSPAVISDIDTNSRPNGRGQSL